MDKGQWDITSTTSAGARSTRPDCVTLADANDMYPNVRALEEWFASDAIRTGCAYGNARVDDNRIWRLV